MEEFKVGDRVKLINYDGWNRYRKSEYPLGTQGTISSIGQLIGVISDSNKDSLIHCRIGVIFDSHKDNLIYCRINNLQTIESLFLLSRLQLILSEKASQKENK